MASSSKDSVIVLLLTATLIGLECFLRKIYPNQSFLAQWQSASGRKVDVRLLSGDGLGYYLGIVGTTLSS